MSRKRIIGTTDFERRQMQQREWDRIARWAADTENLTEQQERERRHHGVVKTNRKLQRQAERELERDLRKRVKNAKRHRRAQRRRTLGAAEG